jgi:regulatory associated protein of mTOR
MLPSLTKVLMSGEQFLSLLTIGHELISPSIYDWRKTTKINSFNNGNPKGTSITSLHFVNEESGGALLAGSSDGVIRVYNNHDPNCSDGKPIQLVSGFRALTTMSQATRGVGIVTEWNQPLTRLLCGGDSEYIYDWDAAKELCVRVCFISFGIFYHILTSFISQ